jgi:ribosomal protein S13
MCLKNNDRKEIKVSFEFLSGIMAQDASEVAKESSIQPAEAAIVRLKDMSKDLINDLNSVVKEEDINLKANDAISSKITMVSILTLIVMVSVGVIETIYIKKYLQNRKLI